LAIINEAVTSGKTLEHVCEILEVNPRAVYRWQSGGRDQHGGGGGRNRITPQEESRIVALAQNHPDWKCRRIAYELERRAAAFVGKTKVAEVMKKHGLNHAFERRKLKPVVAPMDMLLHEPWRKNLLWGMDWTWITINGRFHFLLVLLDWYSRKILSWGLHKTITKFEVVAVATDAVAQEGIDLLAEGVMRPILVADHGSANAAKYTRANIEIQGLHLWLSGIGRPTGNARTERVIGTLKWEEINLQPEYESEEEAYQRIKAKIYDYNFHRPNAGVGGFAPNSVHHQGRVALQKRRDEARQETEKRRRNHWNQGPQAENSSLT
jgi:putative transposase